MTRPRTMPPTIEFTRHGQTTANVDGCLAGSSEVALTELGGAQARELGQSLLARGLEYDTIITSPLTRAIGTAAIVADTLGMDTSRIVIVDELRERDGGNFEGGSLDEFYKARDIEVVAHGGEGLSAFACRLLGASEKVREIHDHKKSGRTLVVAHAEVKRMLDTLALGLPPHIMPGLPKPANTALYDFPSIVEGTRIREGYSVLKGEVGRKIAPRDRFVLVDLYDARGEVTEMMEVPRDNIHSLELLGRPLRRGDRVVAALDRTGNQGNNELAPLPPVSRSRWFDRIAS